MAKQKVPVSQQVVPLEQIRRVLRQVWSWSKGPKDVDKRIKHPEKRGLFQCEKCKEYRERIYRDHIIPVVAPDAVFTEPMEAAIAFMRSLFVPAEKLQGLCWECHHEKTQTENAIRRQLKRFNKGA